jgi:hypothetical protein
MKIFLNSFIIFVLAFSICASQETNNLRMHGLIVGDYFYKAGGDSQPYGDSLSQYSRPVTKDFQAFQIRRLHLFFDYNLSEDFFTRFQLEGNNKSLEPGGRQGLYVKTAYAEWKNIFPKSNLLVGLVPTPTWTSIEGIWGYRSIEKTIADFRNLGSGSDMGILLRGTLPASIPINYAAMIGNGSYQKPENNKYKKFYGMLGGCPVQNISVEAYADYEPAAGGKNITTYKAFFSFLEKQYMIGAEILEQLQMKKDTLGSDYAVFGLSLFGWYQFSQHYKAYGRIDYYDPNRLSEYVGFYEYFISLGLDYMPIKNIHFMPNIWINIFTDKSKLGRKKDADIVPRITFFFVFN